VFITKHANTEILRNEPAEFRANVLARYLGVDRGKPVAQSRAAEAGQEFHQSTARVDLEAYVLHQALRMSLRIW
jgi:hypothetical protein